MPSAKKLLNKPTNIVVESVEGLLLTNPNLKKIHGMNVLVRGDIDDIRDHEVTLITGGGSGHEPAHAGYIGDSMISAAVLGNVFASPSVSSIIAAIRVCASNKGVLLIVKNCKFV